MYKFSMAPNSPLNEQYLFVSGNFGIFELKSRRVSGLQGCILQIT